jgi:hypothetical protein
LFGRCLLSFLEWRVRALFHVVPHVRKGQLCLR